MCHLQNGTAAGGQGPNLSTSREAANANLVKRIVRRGDGAMPAFTQQQVSDKDLDNIVAYLAAIHK
jgi:mono/diheme cytochrome c family protein